MLEPGAIGPRRRFPAPSLRAGAGAAFLALLLASPAAPQAILDLELVEPRSFGYVIGDAPRREVHLSLRSGYRLDRSGLPQAGRLNRWLELAAPQISEQAVESGRRYRLVFTYRIVNAPRQLEAVTLPQLDIGFTDGDESLAATVPALIITVAPLTPVIGATAIPSLRPDRAPGPIPVEARISRLTAILAGLLVLLGYAAARGWILPRLAAARLPFSTAARELERSPRTPSHYAAALKIVHGAVNRTAGHAVFAHELDGFFEAHPRYAGLRDEFEQVFAASRQVFFAGPGAAADGSWPALLSLCRECSRIERRKSAPSS
jgi:mxaA protein